MDSHSQIKVGISVIILIGLMLLGLGLYSVFHKDPAPTASASPSTTPTNPNDLSETYGIYKGTVYNKKTMVVFATRDEFFIDSGKNTFDGLIFDHVPNLPDGLKFVDGRPVKQDDYRRARGQ